MSKEIYSHKKNGLKIFSRVPIPKKSGDYVYFIKIGDDRLYKIGTTNRPLQRIKEHMKNYYCMIYKKNDGKTYGRVIELDITNSSERTQNYIDYIMGNIYTFGY